MKNVFFYILLLFCTSVTAQNTLSINISGIQNDKGQLLLVLTDSNKKQIATAKEKIENGIALICISNLPNGTYAFKYFHDINNDEKLNTNMIGMPKEGFGFSNNAKGSFGPPPFKNTLFHIQNDTVQHCKIMYL